jgi:lipopolysaccharide heptosyltransferase I
MPDGRFLLVRLGSLGDIVHALPAAAALRESFPEARIAWVVERKWRALLDGNPDLDEVIELARGARGYAACARRLRAGGYTCAIDFQGLYKSAGLARLSGAPRRIGFERRFAREGGAAKFYTERVVPQAPHVVEWNLALAERAGARRIPARFPLRVPPEAEAYVERELALRGLREFYLLSPGGGWRGKCWPAERYGHLHRRLAARHALLGLRAVLSYGPGERDLAEAVRLVAGEPEPVILPMDLPQLMAALRRARFFLGGDTGPLHLAVALGTPVVGLYGPTDPARNGPYSPRDVVVRNARPEQTTYKRSAAPDPSMLSITVEQVLEAVERRRGAA